MFSSRKKNAAGGESFEEAAASVTAESIGAEVASAVERPGEPGERFVIREEWAEATVESIFSLIARADHPAWTLTDEETETVAPKMQVFLQAIADRYAPQMLAKFASKHAELFDLTAALGVLLWTKWRFVSKIKLVEFEEAKKRLEREAAEKAAASSAAADTLEAQAA